jgi:H/ACA ribonucleoprotein complex subunit 2
LQKKKIKKEKDAIVINIEELSPIAHPLAEKKLTKKLHKTIKKGLSSCASLGIRINGVQASRVRQVKRGVKEVVKGIRKGENGRVQSGSFLHDTEGQI